jgi:hypothetical protein
MAAALGLSAREAPILHNKERGLMYMAAGNEDF